MPVELFLSWYFPLCDFLRTSFWLLIRIWGRFVVWLPVQFPHYVRDFVVTRKRDSFISASTRHVQPSGTKQKHKYLPDFLIMAWVFVLTSRRDLWRLSFALGQGRRLSHPSAQDGQSPFYINKYEIWEYTWWKFIPRCYRDFGFEIFGTYLRPPSSDPTFYWTKSYVTNQSGGKVTDPVGWMLSHFHKLEGHNG